VSVRFSLFFMQFICMTFVAANALRSLSGASRACTPK